MAARCSCRCRERPLGGAVRLSRGGLQPHLPQKERQAGRQTAGSFPDKETSGKMDFRVSRAAASFLFLFAGGKYFSLRSTDAGL